jgi:hypothetical protein
MAAAAMAAVLLAGCSRVSTGTGVHGSSRAIPGVLRIVGIGSMDSPNPELSAQIAAVDVAMLWGGWFFIVNDKGGLEPYLALD